MKKVNYIFVLASVLIVTVLGIGISYSLWNISVSQDKVNTAMTSCFDITYSSESNAINLEKQYPISDEAGSKLTPYTFKITNSCDIDAYYKINLETLNTSNIDTRFIKASLNNTNPQVINRYNETEVSLKNGKVANTLKSGYLPVGGSISFDLRVWLDYDTTINDIKNDGTDKWVGKIVVISSPVTEDEINKVCQEQGGDLIDGGECRKYYAKVNNFINSNSWILNSATFTIVDKETTKISCTEAAETLCGIFQQPLHVAKFGNKYYVSQKIQNLNIDKKYIIGIEGTAYQKYTKFNNLGSENYSFIFEFNDEIEEAVNYKPHAFILYTQSNLDEPFYTKNPLFTDLTLMFGEGNEPSREWCDKYLDRYIEYNLEGTLIPIKELGEPIKTAYYDKVDMFD